jgi:hypothetical protein
VNTCAGWKKQDRGASPSFSLQAGQPTALTQAFSRYSRPCAPKISKNIKDSMKILGNAGAKIRDVVTVHDGARFKNKLMGGMVYF